MSGAAVGFVGVVVGGVFGVLGVGHAPFEEAGDVCVLWGEGGGEAGGELVPGVPDPEAFGEESVAGGGEGCEGFGDGVQGWVDAGGLEDGGGGVEEFGGLEFEA